MRCKAIEILVDVELQAVTCPGVWLCPNGKITMQIFMLNSCTQTSPRNPIFPLLFHEKFTFRKIFYEVRKLQDIDRYLNREQVYIEMIQWENCELGNVLATFQTSLVELLYPPACTKGILAGVDVDLLMEATRRFPGILAPKIEVSTKTTISEVLCTCPKKKKDAICINPRVLSSKCASKRCLVMPKRQKRVCHTYAYHKAKTCEKCSNPHLCEDCNYHDDLCPSLHDCTCKKLSEDCVQNRSVQTRNRQEYIDKKVKTCPAKAVAKDCLCPISNKNIMCPICTKYRNYFDDPCVRPAPKPKRMPRRTISSARNCTYLDRNERRGRTIRCVSPRVKRRDESPLSRVQQCDCDDLAVQNINRKPSLAKQIHKRLEKSLEAGPSCPYLSEDECLLFRKKSVDYAGKVCGGNFYKNLEMFYKKMYQQAHEKAKNEQCYNKCYKH